MSNLQLDQNTGPVFAGIVLVNNSLQLSTLQTVKKNKKNNNTSICFQHHLCVCVCVSVCMCVCVQLSWQNVLLNTT